MGLCKFCSKMNFKDEYAQKEHLKTHEKIHATYAQCKKVLLTTKLLQRHIKNVHSEKI